MIPHPRPCAKALCPELTHDQFCGQHRRERASRYEQERGSASSRGYGQTWRYVRKGYMRKVGWRCEQCGGRPFDTSKLHLHHIDGNPTGPKRYDHDNLQALCEGCHQKLHAAEPRAPTRWMRIPSYDDYIAPDQRVAIAGFCRSGKTSIAGKIGQQYGLQFRSTDDIRQPSRNFWTWGKQTSEWMNEDAPWIIEGVCVVSGLFYQMNHRMRPLVDVVLWACQPVTEPTDPQGRLNEKIGTARCMVESWLLEHGVEQYEM